jgi:nitrogen fixation/metabolism regulation signal transduction histidine kinase
VLTIPLASRQQETEAQIADLDRRVLLAAVLFIMLGAGFGYYMAERIADPVNRLMRATRRIARGDLDARVLATSSDELRRLVDAFNQMADDLQRQRGELERTNRLAAWADHGAPGGARHQETADAHPVERRALAPRAH